MCCRTLSLSVLLVVLLLGGVLLAQGLPAVATPARPADVGDPLPNNCSDVGQAGEEPPICCAFGYVYYYDGAYYDGVPVASAQVVIRSASGVFTTTTSTGPASTYPYYATALSESPLNVVPGETITVTATYSGATASTVYRVVAKGQQVDVVIPAAEGDRLPIGTINYIHPNPAYQGSDTVAFASSGVDGDEGGASIVAWEWSSNLDGVLSTQEDFLLAASSLSAGTHSISFRVQDNEDNWSETVVRTLLVPFTEHFTTYTYKDTANTTADWNVFDGVLKLPRLPGQAWQGFPAVAVDSAGNSIVVWQDNRNDREGRDSDIYAQKFDVNGNRLWPADVRVNSDSAAVWQEYPVVVLDAKGNAFVVWQDGRNLFRSIYAQKLDPDGHKLWLEDNRPVDKRVDDGNNATNHENARAAPVPGPDTCDDIVVVWDDWRNGNKDIYAQRLDCDGNPRWTMGDVLVNTYGETTDQYTPAVGVDGDKNAYVVWVSGPEDDPDIWAQKLSPAGVPRWFDYCRVNSDTGPAVQDYPAIATDAQGYSYVVWNDRRDFADPGPEKAIYAQRIDADCDKQWRSDDQPEDKRVDPKSATQSYSVAVALDGSSNAFVTWHGRLCDPWCNDIYVQKLDPNGNLPWPDYWRVNRPDTGLVSQYAPAIAVNPAGDIRVAWYDWGTGQGDIYLQRLYAAPNRLWNHDVRVNSDVGMISETPAIAVDPAGNSHVAWADGYNRPYLSIYAQKLNTGGTPQWGYDLRVNKTATTVDLSTPSIAVNGNGTVAVGWDDSRDVYAQILHADGTRMWSNDVRANSDPSVSTQNDPAVAMDSSGNLYVVWTDYRNDSNYPDIYIQKLDSSGIKQWAEDRRVNTDTITVTQSYPAIAFSDTLYVVWEDERNGDSDIYAQRLDLDGNPLWAEDLRVNSDSGTAGQDRPTVAATGGYAHIAWEDWRNGSSEVYARKVASNGSKQWEGDVLIGVGLSPAIVAGSSGHSFVAWRAWNNGNWDIYAQRLDPAGNKVWPTDVRVNSDDGWTNQNNPSVSVDAAENAYVVWEDYRRSSPDIYAQKLLPDGSKAWAGDIRINPDLYLATVAEARSLAVDDTSVNITWATLTVSQTLPNGSAVEYFLSNNGGAAWAEVTPGVQHTFSDTTGSDLHWRAKLLASGDQTQTPVIDWVRLEYSGGSPTCPPPPTPEPLWVDPVTSPTSTLTQTMTVYLGRGRAVTVTSEAGTTVVIGSFDAYTNPARVTINLLPNTTHHLQVTGRVEYVSGCFYTLSTTRDRNGNSLEIVQQSPTPQIKTLILTNRAKIESLYGASVASQLMSKLDQLAAHSSVQGLVVQVENDPVVAAAYSQWDANNITPRANAVTDAIKNLLDGLLNTYPDVKYIVLVGDDRVIPYRRVLDQTRYPESNYGCVSTSSTIGVALGDDMTLTDDFYADKVPTVPDDPDWDGHDLYIPDYALGRLIETPSEITGTIDTFLHDGDVAVNSAISVGYDFVKDGAQRMCDVFKADGIPADCILIGNSWSASRFKSGVLDIRHEAISLNQHANHYLFGAPAGGYISSRDFANASADLTRVIFYSVGCHAGLNVPPDNHPCEPLDLAQAIAKKSANYLANTGYGWGNLYSVGLSERLMLKFTEHLVKGQSATLGEALVQAKQEYYATEHNFDYYDEKIMIEAGLLGLPMYRFTTPGAVASAQFADVVEDTHFTMLANGLSKNSVTYQFPALTRETTDDGVYYSLDGMVESANGQPIQPKYTTNADFPGTTAHGLVFTGGRYGDIAAFDPVVEQALTLTLASQVLAEPPLPAAPNWHPSTFFRLNSLETLSGRTADLVALLGQFNPDTQVERLYDEMSFDIYYHTTSSDWSPPDIAKVTAVLDGSTARIAVETSDASGIHTVVIAYTDGTGVWSSIAMTETHGLWSGTIPNGKASEFLVQVVDGAGNVAVDDNHGSYYTARSQVLLPFVSRQ